MKASCKGRARPNGIRFKMYKDHICQTPDLNEIKNKAAQCHDPQRLIHFARMNRALKCRARQCRCAQESLRARVVRVKGNKNENKSEYNSTQFLSSFAIRFY